LYESKTEKYPLPDENIQIQWSWWIAIIWYQWNVWQNVSNLSGINKIPTDPVDWQKYVYSTNSSMNRYQLMWFIEWDNQIGYILNTTHAATSTRTPRTIWNNLWIILDSNNTPINFNIDVENYTWSSLNVYFNDNYTIEWTWVVIKTIQSSYKDWKMPWTYYDKNCNVPDIVIWNQTWAWCNSTLWNGFEWGQIDANIWTNSYSGTISSCYKLYDWVTTNTWNCIAWDPLMTSNSNPKLWFTWVNWNSDGEYNTIWWKLYTWDNASSWCPRWWHVPTDWEFEALETILYWWVNCRNSTNWSLCSWLWWNRGGQILVNNIAEKLKIPLPGYRASGTNFWRRGRTSFLWSSSQDSSKAYLRSLDSNLNTVERRLQDKTIGSSVRCIKD
jgi:uncharacterized protein (TIGR02145 family)